MKTIYAITCKATGDIKYVGVTKDYHRRRTEHRRFAFSPATTPTTITKTRKPIYQWMREVGREGCSFVILDRVANHKALEAEIRHSVTHIDTILNIQIGKNSKISKRVVKRTIVNMYGNGTFWEGLYTWQKT